MWRALSSALLLLSLLLQPCQATLYYTPLVAPFDASTQCTAGQSEVMLGNSNAATLGDYSTLSLYPEGQLYYSAFNNTAYGGLVTQLSVALADNSNLRASMLLRLGLYVLNGGNGIRVGQTDLITLYPSPATTVHAVLQQPVTLLMDAQYLVAVQVASDSSWLYFGQWLNLVQPAVGAAGGSVSASFNDYSLPARFQPSSSYSSSGGLAVQASGCYDPHYLDSATMAFYAICAYTESYWPAPANASQYASSSTAISVLQGTLIVSTTPKTTAFGTGFAVTAATAELVQSSTGLSPYYPASTTHVLDLTAGGNKITSVQPSNLLYTDGTTPPVDGLGISFLSSTGLQLLLQYDAVSRQYQLVNSSNNGEAPTSLPLFSNVTLTRITTANEATLPPQKCTATGKAAYTPDAPIACPAGSLPVQFGDTDLSDTAYAEEGGNSAMANAIFFRLFSVNTAGTTINTLQYSMLQQPGSVFQMRMGVFAVANASATYSSNFTLLAQTAPLTLYNPPDLTVSANLPSALQLPVGVYALGIWFDAAVYAAYVAWPNSFMAQLPFSAVSSDGAFPLKSVGRGPSQVLSQGATGCVANSAATVQLQLCAAFSYSTRLGKRHHELLFALQRRADRHRPAIHQRLRPLLAGHRRQRQLHLRLGDSHSLQAGQRHLPDQRPAVRPDHHGHRPARGQQRHRLHHARLFLL